MGTRNTVERRKAAGKHRKESFSVKREVVARYEPQANKSFLHQQFFKNAGEVWASSPHLRSKSKICNMVFLLQSHFLKLSNSSKVEE